MQTLPPIYYIVFTAVTAAAVLLQFIVLLAIYIAIRRSMGKLQETLDEVKAKALPAIASTQSLLDEVSPKLKTTTSNLAEMSEALRGQASHVNATVESLLDKTNAQINRVDDMVTATFNALGQASRAIDLAIGLPVRRVTGMLHGLKVGVDVLMGKRVSAPQPSANEAVSEVSAPAEIPSAAEQKPVRAI
jgi:uncharacterized membrane protein